MQQLIPFLITAVAAGAALTIVASGAILAAAAVRRARVRRMSRPTGSLVAAADTDVHVVRRGPRHGPTVVLIAGVGGVAAQWAGIQDRLGDGVGVGSIAYDRPGLGWSGPARGPRTVDSLADELHLLLEALPLHGPFVLVGHSLGGVIARHHAVRHPGDVAGLVLVDSAHEEQFRRMPEMERVFRRMTALPEPVVRLLGAVSALRRTPADPRLPAAAAEEVRTATIAHSSHLPTAMAEMRAASMGTPPVASLGDLPVVVLRHGRFERMPMLAADLNERFEALFADLQAEIAALSTRGRVVVAQESGHDIHLDQPELVISAIREVVEAAWPNDAPRMLDSAPAPGVARAWGAAREPARWRAAG